MNSVCFNNGKGSFTSSDTTSGRNLCNYTLHLNTNLEVQPFRSLDHREPSFTTAFIDSSDLEEPTLKKRSESSEHLDRYVGAQGPRLITPTPGQCSSKVSISGASDVLPNSGTCGIITAEELFMKMKLRNGSERPLVLLDIRENRLYHTSHIQQAKSASCHTKMMVKRAVATWSIWFADPKTQGNNEVIIYDQRSDVPTSTTGPLKLYISHLRILGNDVKFLEGGLDSFQCVGGGTFLESSLSDDSLRKHAHSPTSTSEKSDDVLNATATEILPFLFLGNERDTSDSELLESIGITHILNATNSVPFYLESSGRYRYHRLPATDCQRQDLRKFFTEAFEFIDEARSSGGKVLIHCWAGVSRSATIVMAYLLQYTELPVTTVLHFLRGLRSVVAPNFNFMGQLERFYSELESGQAVRKPYLDSVILQNLSKREEEEKSRALPELNTPLILIENPFLK